MKCWLVFIVLFFFSACATTTTVDSSHQNLKGFERAHIIGVANTSEGSVVLLSSMDSELMLPIFINPLQAMTIGLRLEGRQYTRPLTHDLLESIVGHLDAQIVKIHIDSLQDDTFHATLFILNSTKTLEIDSRPSDAIALSARGDIPIYISDEILEAAGLTEKDVQGTSSSSPSPTTPL